MAVVVKKEKLTRLRRAMRENQLPDEFTKVAAELTRDEIRDNWSGTYPPASSPGEAPAIRTGTLDLSIEVIRTGRSHMCVVNAPYGHYLEFGTSKMAARPFVRPATEKVKEAIAALSRQAMDRFLRGAIAG